MLNKNVIEPSTSPWASGVVLVKMSAKDVLLLNPVPGTDP
jgi:hypothetical protein